MRAAVCQKPGDRRESDPQLQSRDWWSTHVHGEIGECEYDGVCPRLSETPGSVRSASPMIGADTFDVMRDIVGLTDEEIAENQGLGVFM